MPDEASSTASPTEEIRVLIVDDHKLMSDCLTPLLEENIAGLSVVGTAEDGTSGVDRCFSLEPDIVIMDIDIPGMGPFEAARTIMKRLPDTRVMFLSAHQHDEYIEQALAVGASGYVVKHDGLPSIVDAVKRIVHGELFYSEAVLGRVVFDGKGGVSLDRPQVTRLTTLTERERQILIMLAKGESVKRIANALNIAYKTVDKHKVSLMRKLDIHDRVELCRFAVREKLIEA